MSNVGCLDLTNGRNVEDVNSEDSSGSHVGRRQMPTSSRSDVVRKTRTSMSSNEEDDDKDCGVRKSIEATDRRSRHSGGRRMHHSYSAESTSTRQLDGRLENVKSSGQHTRHKMSSPTAVGPCRCTCFHSHDPRHSDDNFLAHYQQSHSHSPTQCCACGCACGGSISRPSELQQTANGAACPCGHKCSNTNYWPGPNPSMAPSVPYCRTRGRPSTGGMGMHATLCNPTMGGGTFGVRGDALHHQRWPHQTHTTDGGGDLLENGGDSSDSSEEKFPPIIGLNVGGHRFMTRLSTLRKYPDSMLSTMFSGRHHVDRDHDGYYFLDTNGMYFEYVLDFLRHDELPGVGCKSEIILQVYKLACYFGLSHLQNALRETAEISRLNVKQRHRDLFPSYYAFRQQVIQLAMKNGTATKVGEVIVFAHQRESKNIHNSCVTETAHLKIGPWEANGPDDEVFIRTLHGDLVELGFNLSAFEKRRCKWYVQGQSCQRCVYKLIFHFE